MAREYGFLMIGYNKPSFIQELQDSIPSEELYVEDGNDDYGLEKNTHVTLVPCLDRHTDINDLKQYLKALNEYHIILGNVSKFDNEKYDVLKCDVGCCNLMNTNSEICSKFPTFSEYKEYHPHLTIAYLKKGMADKYLRDSICPLVCLKPTKFIWSGCDNEDNEINIDFE